MTDLLAARLQMAISLGFHIIFACIGMTMPFLMAVAHRRAIRTRDPLDERLTDMWARGVAVFFAVGAVSGTALSFELGLLWPRFMEHAGAIIGLPFSLEGTAFFIEAIALGFFLYGKGRIPERARWWAGLTVGLMGLASGGLVICANAWMNSPAGFDWNGGVPTNIDPLAAMLNAAAPTQVLHMLIASFVATGFGVAGLHAWLLYRNPLSELHKRALIIALWFAVPAAALQPLSGDLSAKHVAKHQPVKLAAMEAHFRTERRAPLIIGGIPDVENQKVDYALRLPGLLSFLAFGDFDAPVRGLEEFRRDDWPPVPIVHYAFQVMVGIGLWLIGIGLWSIWCLRFRPGWLFAKPTLAMLAACSPLGFIAVEAGWVVTEVGRQPWIIYGLRRTKDALTPMPGLWAPLLLFTSLYLLLSLVVVWTMIRRLKVYADEPEGTPDA